MRKLLFECYDRTFEGMTDSEWRVFCAICKHANDETGGDCFPGTLLLAKESRLHKNTVPPQIKSLEEKSGFARSKKVEKGATSLLTLVEFFLVLE